MKGGRPTVVSRSVGRGLARAATLKKLPRVRVNANGRTLRIQRKTMTILFEETIVTDSKHLKFIVFLLHILADSWHKKPSGVYAVLKDSGVLDGYILPSYDVLHTLGARYLVKDITGCVRDWGGNI